MLSTLLFVTVGPFFLVEGALYYENFREYIMFGQ